MTAQYVSRHTNRPIGIFDSGIGGLSVLQHIHEQLPQENLIYFADSGFAPYGDKPDQVIIDRSYAILEYLLQVNSKAIVVACNTATASAIHLLRERYPDLPIVGIEPGLKPATTMTGSGVVGVMATERTLASQKFHLLYEQLSERTGVHFVLQACPGLADLIEQGDLHSPKMISLVERYTRPLIEQNVDTIVLGCTHYPFIKDIIKQTAYGAGADILHIIDTGLAVTKQLIRVLDESGLRSDLPPSEKGNVSAFTTGEVKVLTDQFKHLLNIQPPIQQISLQI